MVNGPKISGALSNLSTDTWFSPEPTELPDREDPPTAPTTSGNVGKFATDAWITTPDPSAALEGARDTNPDAYAKSLDLSRATGLPVEAVEQDPEPVKRVADQLSTDSWLSDAPATRRFMSDPVNAKLAHDDVEGLSAIERISRAFKSGRTMRDLGQLGVEYRKSRSPETLERIKDNQKRLAELHDGNDGFIGWLSAYVEILGQNFQSLSSPEASIRIGGGATVGTAIGVAGGPLAPVTSSAGAVMGGTAGLLSHLAVDAFEVEGGLSYIEQLDLGIDPDVASWTSLAVGVVNSGLEMAAATVILRPIAQLGKTMIRKGIREAIKSKGVKSAAARMAATYGSAIAAEVSTEVMQEMVNIAAEEIGKFYSEGEFAELTQEEVNERLSAIAEQTFKAMVFGAVPGAGASFVSTRVEARKAQANREVSDEMKAEVDKSKLAKRDPKKSAEHLAGALEFAGIKEVFIPMNKLAEIAEAETSDLAGFYRTLGITDQVEEATAIGGDIRLTGEQYAEHVMLSERYEQVADHIRFVEGAMTVAEAKELEEFGFEDDIAEFDAGVARANETIPDREVTVAENELGLKELFRTADEAGIPPKQYETYLTAVARAAEVSRNRQAQKHIKRQQKQNTKEMKAAREIAQEEAQSNVNSLPTYEVLNSIGRDRLDRDAVIALLPNGEAQLKDLPKSNGQVIYTPKGERGLDPDAYADLYDHHSDGQTMLFAFIDAGPVKQAIEAETDKIMLAEFGELLDEATALDAAIKSLHHDNQANVLAFELNQLRDAQKAGRIKPAVLRAAAKARIQEYEIGDITPSKFLAAQRREGRKAGRLLRKGDREGATRAKFNQLMNFLFAQEAYKVRDQVRKEQNFLQKFTKPKKHWPSLPDDYLEAIRDILSDYQLGPRLSDKKRKSLEAWARNKAEKDGTAIQIPKRIQDEDNRRHFSTLPLDEWRQLHDTVKAIHKQGTSERKLLIAEENRTRDEVVAEVAELIEENFSGGNVNPTTLRERISFGGRAVITTLMNADTILREIDGFRDLGPAYQATKGRIDKATFNGYHPGQIGLILRQQKEAQRLTELFDVYSKTERLGMGVKMDIPGVSSKLTKNEVISVMLNLGNADNRTALLESQQFTEDELVAIQNFADKKDWEFVQSIWDYYEEFWPEIKEATQRRRGLVPERVEAIEIETKHGKFKGGYHPLKYDRKRSILPREDDAEEAIRKARFGLSVFSHTARGHTEERVGSGGRNVLLDLRVINSHIDEVVYDLEVGDAITDAYRTLHHPEMIKAFEEAGRIMEYEALDLWLGDAITGERHLGGWVEGSFRWMRTGFTVSKLGWNLGTAALQPLGILQTSAQIGKKATFYGVRAMLSGKQIGENSIYNFVAAQTTAMASRAENFNADMALASKMLSESLLARVTPGRSAEILARSFFYLIIKMQRFVDTATWLGAKHKGMDQFAGDEQKANDFADRMVLRSQASGVFTERTQFERGSLNKSIKQTELVRVFTGLISYFMAKSNVAYERTRRTNFKNPGQIFNWAVDMSLLYLGEAILVGLIRGQWPDDEDDEDGWPSYVAEESINAIMAGVPFLREFVSEAVGFRGGGIFSSTVGEVGKLTDQLGQIDFEEVFDGDFEDIDAALLKTMNNLGGIFFKYPSAQINKTAEAIAKHNAGEDVEAIEFLMGPRFEK